MKSYVPFVVIGFLFGGMITNVINKCTSTSDELLNKVGIDHIEQCHNVHSNWCEIVWLKDVK